MKRSTALVLYLVLACLFGWAFVLARSFGADIDPGLLPIGPILAAAIVSAARGGENLREWGRRLITWRAGAAWYALAFLAPVVILLAAVLANMAFGAPLPTREQLAGWPGLAPTFLVILVLIGMGEEAGWTAFAAPLLLERHRLIRAWLILASMRTVWHIPLMLQGNLPLTTGIAGNFAFQFFALWMMSRTSVWLLAAVWHAMVNTMGGEFLFGFVGGADRARLGVLMVAGHAVLVLAVLVYNRGRHVEEGAQPAAAQ